MNKNDDSKFFDAGRLKDLGDAIFAFAMTFLIVTIDIPMVSPERFNAEMLKLAPNVLAYVLSFFLLAIFWMTNHIQLKNIKKTDGRLIWISMTLFLMIVFVPLTTDLYSFYDGSRLAMFLFNLNILLIGLVFILQWHHLAANNLHHDEFTKDEVRDRYKVSAALVAVAAVAIVVGFFSPIWSAAVYLVMFIYRMRVRLKWATALPGSERSGSR